MPISLSDFFINFLTSKNDLVLDPFGGSCTTGKSAEQLGRKWIMVEKDKDGQYPAAYDDIINSRSTFIFDMGDMPGLLLEKNPNVCRKINDVWIIKSWQLSCERGPDVRR